MFKEAYIQIKESYEGDVVIYPPVLYADDSLGEWPNIAFFVAEKKGTDMVIVNSQTGEVVGVTSVQGVTFNKQHLSCDIDHIDEEITSICISMMRDISVVKDAYAKYLRQNFLAVEEMNLVAALCPNAISNDILRGLGSTPRLAQDALAELGRKIVFMEKNIPEVLKEIPAWIDSVSTAKAYKNAVIAGNGDRLFRVIKMVGNQEAYKTCVADFAHFLFRMNLVKDKKISTTTAEWVHSNVEQVTNSPGNYWFFDDNHNPAPGTKMVIFNIEDVKLKNQSIKRLIGKIGLTVEYSTLSLFLEDYPGWEDIAEDDFVNNTILSHYSSYQDDVLKASDLEWINDILIGNDANSIIKTSKKVEKKEVKQQPHARPGLPKENQMIEIVVEEKANEPTVEVKAAVIANILDDNKNEENAKSAQTADKETKANNSDDNLKESPTTPNQDTEDIPSPEDEDEIEDETIESAQAKIAFNKQLNAKMYEVYEQTATRLKQERDPRWKDFISEYKKAIEDENYTVKICPRYLNMTSRDVKSAIYKVLYEADQATKQYERDLQRMRRKTLCFACRKPFYADLTFAKHKEHTDKCHNCGNLVRMTIDWLN